ncbi:MAG: DUF1343 domain-containing protein [Polyangiaceae bacterium]
MARDRGIGERGARRGRLLASGVVLLAAACSVARPPHDVPPPVAPPGASPEVPVAVLPEADFPDAGPSITGPLAEPVDDGLATVDDARFAEIDAAARDAVRDRKFPGAVVVVGSKDTVLFRKAYGMRSLVPTREAMTVDTIFDLASITKPVATSTAIMVLVDRGKLDLDAPVSDVLPEWNRVKPFTLRQLMTHTAGLPIETPKKDYASGRANALARILARGLAREPGSEFVYSDVGFILAEEIVRRVSGDDLAAFVRREVFEPLGMADTGFRPSALLKPRIAPTEWREGDWARGLVHDPRAYLLGGVAGNAGLFATASDLSRFARMILGGGAYRGVRILSKKTVDAWIAPHDVVGGVRALGWDVRTKFSANRGDTASPRAFGHGGYTGTSFWIDPETESFAIMLANRVHPDGKGAVNAFASLVGTVAGRVALAERGRGDAGPCVDAAGVVETGIDVLRSEDFARLRGANVGLVTNVSGRAKDGERTIDLLVHAPGVRLLRLFAPEHGLDGDKEGHVKDGVDPRSGLPVTSLYGDAFAPPDSALEGLDTLVFDVQDAGTRYYTYVSTLRNAMDAAAARGLRFVVLDRPNPIDGVDVAGPLLETTGRSALAYHPLPVRHGLTLGELAYLMNADRHVGARLDVVRMRGWRRADYFEATGLPWTKPSPNLRTIDEVLLYPAVGLVEGTNVSVGRGTDTPFEHVGAPWMDATAVLAAFVAEKPEGVVATTTSFTPTVNPHKGKTCNGIALRVASRSKFEPVRAGLALARAIARVHPSEWHQADVVKLLANAKAMDALASGKSVPAIEATWAPALASFRTKRENYLLYPNKPTCAPAPPVPTAATPPTAPSPAQGAPPTTPR